MRYSRVVFLNKWDLYGSLTDLGQLTQLFFTYLEKNYIIRQKTFLPRKQTDEFLIFSPVSMSSNHSGLICVKKPFSNISCLGPFKKWVLWLGVCRISMQAQSRGGQRYSKMYRLKQYRYTIFEKKNRLKRYNFVGQNFFHRWSDRKNQTKIFSAPMKRYNIPRYKNFNDEATQLPSILENVSITAF